MKNLKKKLLKKSSGIDGILVTAGLCIIALIYTLISLVYSVDCV